MMSEAAVIPMQPYILLKTEAYQRVLNQHNGISHFYEFKMRGNGRHILDAVPDSSVDLLFNIGRNQVHTYISGTVFRAKSWEMGNENLCFGIRFQPGKCVLPKALSMDMLVNQDMEITADLFDDDLAERIVAAKDISERADIFEQAYNKLLNGLETDNIKGNMNQYIVNRITASNGTVSMEQLSEETNYSSCYIRKVFKSYHGISPKQFSKYIRFQYLLSKIKQTDMALNELALECGYYDEPHMMKEFKSYTGVTLNQYKKMVETMDMVLGQEE